MEPSAQPTFKDLPPSKYLMIEDSSTHVKRRISYYKIEGKNRPGVVFIPGFMANKEHKKSIETLRYCLERDIPCISYDTAGYGDSTHEVKRTEARFTHWLQDAREIILKLTDGPQVIVGSSMGGWLGMILGQEMPTKFAGLILLAPAYNFGEMGLKQIEDSNLPSEVLEQMRNGLVLEQLDPKFPDYGPVPISYDLFEGTIPFNVPLQENKIDINFPVRILHGTKDELFPCSRSEILINALKSTDVKFTILKGCVHELSDPKGLQSIFQFIEELRELVHKR